MKILFLADIESKFLWDYFDKSKLEGVDLIISCGDLSANYLSFLATFTHAPILYVRGNHDGRYEQKPPEGCIDIEPKAEITFDDFEKLQFQVGEIIACEEVKKSKKLLCSQVKVGSQVKQIVSGIKAHYTPEEMVGKKVMVLVNLKPAKLAGVLSEGMLLCAEDAEGNLALMTPEKEMPAGAEIC